MYVMVLLPDGHFYFVCTLLSTGITNLMALKLTSWRHYKIVEMNSSPVLLTGIVSKLSSLPPSMMATPAVSLCRRKAHYEESGGRELNHSHAIKIDRKVVLVGRKFMGWSRLLNSGMGVILLPHPSLSSGIQDITPRSFTYFRRKKTCSFWCVHLKKHTLMNLSSFAISGE